MSQLKVDYKRKSTNGLYLTEYDVVEIVGIKYLAIPDIKKKTIDVVRRDEYNGPLKKLCTWTGNEKIIRGLEARNLANDIIHWVPAGITIQYN